MQNEFMDNTFRSMENEEAFYKIDDYALLNGILAVTRIRKTL